MITKSKFKNPDKFISHLKADLEYARSRVRSLSNQLGNYWFGFSKNRTICPVLNIGYYEHITIGTRIAITAEVTGLVKNDDGTVTCTLSLKEARNIIKESK
jgi:hypothetical protein